jgi:hypothetical protein
LVLGLLLILGGIATDVGRAARLDSAIVASLRARTVARYAAESGVALGLTVLRSHKMPNIAEVTLGDARFGVVAVNLNARIDLSRTDTATVRGLFEQFTDRSSAGAIARELAARPLQRVGELTLMPDVPDVLASAVAPYVTIWGDGAVDTTAAPEAVRAALSPSAALVGGPTRVLLVARGWQNRFPLTHEIQAVYAIQGQSLELVAWQERDL